MTLYSFIVVMLKLCVHRWAIGQVICGKFTSSRWYVATRWMSFLTTKILYHMIPSDSSNRGNLSHHLASCSWPSAQFLARSGQYVIPGTSPMCIIDEGTFRHGSTMSHEWPLGFIHPWAYLYLWTIPLHTLTLTTDLLHHLFTCPLSSVIHLIYHSRGYWGMVHYIVFRHWIGIYGSMGSTCSALIMKPWLDQRMQSEVIWVGKYGIESNCM